MHKGCEPVGLTILPERCLSRFWERKVLVCACLCLCSRLLPIFPERVFQGDRRIGTDRAFRESCQAMMVF